MYSHKAGSVPNSRRMILGAAVIAAFFAILTTFSPASAEAARASAKLTGVIAPSKMIAASQYIVGARTAKTGSGKVKGSLSASLSSSTGFNVFSGPGPIRLGKKSVTLRKKGKSQVLMAAKVPSDLAAGGYKLIICLKAPDQTCKGKSVTTFEAKYPKAVECLVKDRDALLAFYDFPAEHWIHLRTTNPIESTFATVRHRTKVTKGPGSKAAGIAMAFKLIEAAQARWRCVNAPHLVALVRAGARFHRGKLLERDPAPQAVPADANSPDMTPAASTQPINTAA